MGSNWGGTRIEPWTTLDGFKSVPELSQLAESVAAYNKETKVGGGTPSAIYNSMVHPSHSLRLTWSHLVSGRIKWKQENNLLPKETRSRKRLEKSISKSKSRILLGSIV